MQLSFNNLFELIEFYLNNLPESSKLFTEEDFNNQFILKCEISNDQIEYKFPLGFFEKCPEGITYKGFIPIDKKIYPPINEKTEAIKKELENKKDYKVKLENQLQKLIEEKEKYNPLRDLLSLFPSLSNKKQFREKEEKELKKEIEENKEELSSLENELNELNKEGKILGYFEIQFDPNYNLSNISIPKNLIDQRKKEQEDGLLIEVEELLKLIYGPLCNVKFKQIDTRERITGLNGGAGISASYDIYINSILISTFDISDFYNQNAHGSISGGLSHKEIDPLGHLRDRHTITESVVGLYLLAFNDNKLIIYNPQNINL